MATCSVTQFSCMYMTYEMHLMLDGIRVNVPVSNQNRIQSRVPVDIRWFWSIQTCG